MSDPTLVPDGITPVVALRSWIARDLRDMTPPLPELESPEAWRLEGMDWGLISVHHRYAWTRGVNEAAPCDRMAPFSETPNLTVNVGVMSPQGPFNVAYQINGGSTVSFRLGRFVFTTHLYYDEVVTGDPSALPRAFEPVGVMWNGNRRYPVAAGQTNVELPMAELDWTVTDLETNEVRTHVSLVHDPPGAVCSCGLYAASTLGMVPISEVYGLGMGSLVVGVVELFGTVIAGERGWRASKARIVGLFGHRAIDKHKMMKRRERSEYDANVTEIAATYGVPVLDHVPELTDPNQEGP